MVLGALTLAALAAAAVVAVRRLPSAAVGISWLLVALAPVSHVVPILNVAAERFLDLPSLGWCVALAAVVARLPPRRPALAALAVVLLAYGARTASASPAR